MPNFTTHLGSQNFEQVRALNNNENRMPPAVSQNGLDEILFEVEGQHYLGVSESLKLNGLKQGDKLQVQLGGEKREAVIQAINDDITSFSEGWSKGSSFGDSMGKAYAGMMSSPNWSMIHNASKTVSRWPQAENPVSEPVQKPSSNPPAPIQTIPETESPPNIQPPTSGPATPKDESVVSSKIEVFFSRAEGSRPDEKLAEFILSADTTIDIAAFELESEVVRDAILEAHSKGRQVRVVTDSNYKDEHDIQALKAAGIEVIDDQRSGLMHNKFVVIDNGEDDAAVWMGSMNMTDNGMYRNDNNAQIIRSTELAENYTAEFNEMFVDKQFGVRSPDFVPHPTVNVSGVNIETHFAAEGRVIGKVAEALNEATESIHFMTFSFTHAEIGDVVSQKIGDGLVVRGVFDHQQAGSKYSQYHRLKSEGADVKRDGNPKFLHHKVFIIDGDTVVTGSFNFSKSADKSNDENLLIIEDEALAQKYLTEFNRIYTESANNPANSNN